MNLAEILDAPTAERVLVEFEPPEPPSENGCRGRGWGGRVPWGMAIVGIACLILAIWLLTRTEEQEQ